MKNLKKVALIVAILVGIIAGPAFAGTRVTSDISGNVTWTKSGSPYQLDGQIFVLPNASLTIEAGTVIASVVAEQGSLAVCKGAQIFVNGTATEPVIMTSMADVETWAGTITGYDTDGDLDVDIDDIILGDPKTGQWRASCNEWGNLTVMGAGLISASHKGEDDPSEGTVREVVVRPDGSDNTKTPSGLNMRDMEGFNASLVSDTKIWYGGNDDNDDSGSISYLSLRYGGKVIGLANELNGLSLGGIGRATDISHVEIMNNVDDGIEIWGGTVELDHVSIWNIGDDSFDIDQGWRGSASYGLIVQGYSVDAKQGSGVGDNCFEHDGAEASDAQPVTTGRIEKFTAIGQPLKGDHGTAWRDNCRMQYDSCIWMDLGEQLVKFDGDDGDGAEGYGHNGTHSWADVWDTTYTQWAGDSASGVNLGGFSLQSIYGDYMTQDTTGKLAQITNSVFYNNANASAYSTYNTVNTGTGNTIATLSPVKGVYRGFDALANGNLMPVESLNPIPADGVTAGAFNGSNWLAGWTAADAFGLTDTSMNTASADLNTDGIVDLADFAGLSAQWLK